ncbi:MAG: sodium:proton exchanger [Planctomycetales bacterium]|nr:sodium:proton exchanger [Planctomycetales bacterium]NIM07577.1 sodium:proton exchanger [Planctomycetales bacterium]NIN07083.1 sodium:proton exchanger [Planctomycetales bacterium]NIN76177.1 sodium:proton exchanger [Planctomycetales bacterium]NIO33399.1 sodium:proton exchanger [Planctomycetales bacterium]
MVRWPFLAATNISTTLTLAAVVVLAIGAQWVAWRLRVPSILLLLIVGFLAGPVTGYLNPDQLLDANLLFALVSLSVALILFEGGLTLQFGELRESGAVIRNLCTMGALLTAVLTTLAALLFLQTGLAVSIILGTMLVVTGPTVVGPLLRHIRPVGRVGTIAKWEGIVIDPVGAMLAVLAFACVEALSLRGAGSAVEAIVVGLIKTVFWGGLLGLAGALPTIFCLRRYWIPDHLQSPVLLTVVVGCFAAANSLQAESGLFAVTLMGVLIVNQKNFPIKHIIEFKENLRVLLISLLFIVLAARIQPDAMTGLGWGSVAFVAVLMLVIRPAAVLLSTMGAGLTWQERIFLGWMAPRGIVAAALASVFALALRGLPAGASPRLQLVQAGDVDKLVPVTFLVIVVTVAVYGLTAAPLARWLGLATAQPQGALIAGADRLARAIAQALHDAGFAVLLVDTNRDNIQTARMAGLPTFYASILSEHALEEVELGGIGRLLALTSNDEVNALAALHFSEVFGRAEVYQLTQTVVGVTRQETAGGVLRGRQLFHEQATYGNLHARLAAGAVVKKTSLTTEFDYGAFQDRYGPTAFLLFVLTASGGLQINTVDQPVTPKAGDTVIALVEPVADAETP